MEGPGFMRELGNYLQERMDKTRIEFKPSNIFPHAKNEPDTTGVHLMRRSLSVWIKEHTSSRRLFMDGYEIVVLRDSSNPLYAAIKVDTKDMDGHDKLTFIAQALGVNVDRVVTAFTEKYSEYQHAISNARIQSKVIMKQQSAITRFCKHKCKAESQGECKDCLLMKVMALPEQKRLVLFKEEEKEELCV